MAYYDGARLLSLSDIEGKKPEIYMSETNRSAGKTTYFGRRVVKRFLEKNEKFMLLYRFNYELNDVADKFFNKEIGPLFFQGRTMKAESRNSGKFMELLLDEKECGYAVALNDADSIKRLSHFFSDTACILFDEFQSETNKYCSDEVRKFQSIHLSVARGGGKTVRRVPVYMLSNPISLLNPYYTAMGITSRMGEKTKYLRGPGFVLEKAEYTETAHAQLESAFNRAFAGSEYIKSAAMGYYLNDSQTFVEKLSGKNRYLATLKYDGTEYALREFEELGLLYCDKRVDGTYKHRITADTADHSPNFVMLKNNNEFIKNLRFFFEKGRFRFYDLQCKNAVLFLLSY